MKGGDDTKEKDTGHRLRKTQLKFVAIEMLAQNATQQELGGNNGHVFRRFCGEEAGVGDVAFRRQDHGISWPFNGRTKQSFPTGDLDDIFELLDGRCLDARGEYDG